MSFDLLNLFQGDALFAVSGWLAGWKAKPVSATIPPWFAPGDMTQVYPGAKLVTRASVPIHKPGLESMDGAWKFGKNSGLYIQVRRGLAQKGTKINMFEAAEFDVTSFDMSPETMAIEIGNQDPLNLAAILNGCFSGTPQDALGNPVPDWFRLIAYDQIYGGNGVVGQGTGSNGSGTMAVLNGDTANYKPVNPARDTIGQANGWFNAEDNFDFSNPQSYVTVLETMGTRKAMNDVELNLVSGPGLRLLISYSRYERARLLFEVFEELAQSGIVAPYFATQGVNITNVNSLVESFNQQALFGTQKNPVFGRMEVVPVTGLRSDLAVIVAPRPRPEPQYATFLLAHGGQLGSYEIQTNPAAMLADTVPHIAVYPWTQTNGPLFFGAGAGNAAGDIGLSMVVNTGAASVSGLCTHYLFEGPAS